MAAVDHRTISTPLDTTADSSLLDAKIIGVGIVLAFGLYLDGWAHAQGYVDLSLLSRWHLPMYAGYLLIALLLIDACVRRWLAGRRGRAIVPSGYGWTLVATPLFLISGVGDVIWHQLFGVETSIAALLSPTHIVLLGSGALVAASPLRAAWLRAGPVNAQPFLVRLSCATALILLYGLWLFLTQFVHPLANPVVLMPSAGEQLDRYHQIAGATSVMLQTAACVGLLLFAVRESIALKGFGAALMIFSTCAMISQATVFRPAMLIVGLAGGLIAEALIHSPRRRWLAAMLGAIPTTIYIGLCAADQPLWWSVHILAGIVVLAGVSGYLVHWLVRGPAPQESS